MMPSIILGLSALLLGAAGQSQYRPGGLSENDGGIFSGGAEVSNDGDYLDYQEQAQYRPGRPSDYEYDYENSITGGTPGTSGGSQTQQVDGSQKNGDQSQYGNQNGGGSFGIAGSTGNVGTGINGDLDRPSGSQSNRPNSNKGGAGQSNFGSTVSGGISGNVGSGLQDDPKSGQNTQANSGGRPTNTEANENTNQKTDDKNAWSLAESIPGVAGDDYPVFTNVPDTSFECDGLVSGGYYADPEAECQSFHVCASDGNGGLTKYSFMCPNGTIFNQQVLVCDWWFNVDCSLTEDLYSINVANAAERDANIGAGSEEKDAKNFGNKDGKNAASKASSVQQGNGQSQRQSLLSDDNSSRTSILLGSDPVNSSRKSNGKDQDARLFGSETRPAKHQNSRGKNSRGGARNNEQKGTYKAPGGSESDGINQSQNSLHNGGKQNDQFQSIQNGQNTGIENSREGFSGSASIQPLDTGYGAPGGQIRGSYNQY